MRLPRRTIPFLAALVLLSTACGGDDPAGPSDPFARFVGSWTGISAVLTPVGGGTPFDLILAGGNLDIVVQPSGSFSMTLVFAPFMVDLTTGGTITVGGSQITMVVTGQPTPFGSSFTGTFAFTQGDTRMTFNLTGGVDFDFNLDGQPEPASLTLVLRKQ